LLFALVVATLLDAERAQPASREFFAWQDLCGALHRGLLDAGLPADAYAEEAVALAAKLLELLDRWLYALSLQPHRPDWVLLRLPLALVCIDNPMAPGTGHRICNDCMKACVYQKQDPVNIPQIETRVLTDVLRMRWGFEIWSLLTRWNPLRFGRQHPRPYAGVNVLVVGMGPAGYTLAHHLLNEGFGVVGVDGLKIEPLPEHLLTRPLGRLETAFGKPLDERVTSGFGGVSEYGITVRWDNSFLDILHLNLARRTHFALYGGTRFGGTVTLKDAFERYGFHHVALAAGAGRPTIIGL